MVREHAQLYFSCLKFETSFMAKNIMVKVYILLKNFVEMVDFMLTILTTINLKNLENCPLHLPYIYIYITLYPIFTIYSPHLALCILTC